ncbi:MAG: endonuclease/exonuclease/phosphatase family protein [Calditrichaeota bacterium]|nr:endonuclease/exonuclease/phosphatase family protein [Calditrichota bacterium]
MSRNILMFLFVVFMLSNLAAQDNAPVKVMSLNIRYDNPDDGSNAWTNRKELIIQTIRKENPDLIGFQEALSHQVSYLDSALSDYHFYGVGRDDGLTKGEFSPVFFKSDRFLLLDVKTFWLSDTPEKAGSIGKGAVLPRIVTLVNLFDLKNRIDLWMFNTHFSHVSDSARLQSVRILLDKAKQIVKQKPLIIAGDFNVPQGSGVYRKIIDEPGLELKDTYFASKTPHSGGLQTFNGFGKVSDPVIIDHIFCNRYFEVTEHYFIPLKIGALWISDHFPVVTILQVMSDE